MNRLKSVLPGCALIALILCSIIGALAYSRRNDIAAIWDIIILTAEQTYPNPLTTPDEVLTYLQTYPDSFGLIAYTVNPDGSPVEESIVAHNADKPFVLASTIKILLLGAYAREVAAGQLDPGQPISLAEWERFYLPNTDGGAHPAALDDLQIPHTNGFANDPTQTVTLDRVVNAMIRFSDNAATDLLLYRIGEESIAATIAGAGLTHREPPLPLSGVFLSWQNHEQATLTEAHLTELLGLPYEEFATQAWMLSDRLRADDEWYQAEREWRIAETRSVPIRLQARAISLSPSGSVQDYADVMGRVVTNTFLSPEVSAIMRPHLEWPMQFEGNQAEFTALGSKGGSLVGVLTGATYYIPKTGDFAGQPRVVVLFMNDIPFSAWLTFSQTFAWQFFEKELAISHSFADKVRATFP